MPVGTRGTIKAISSEDIAEIGYQLILGNTYHLYLRPGMDVISSLGGLKKFMSYNGALLTDSGGFQVFSLKGLFKFLPDGVSFRSHIDGSKHIFTPEKVIDIQRTLGSDIAMVLDDCPEYGANEKRLKESLDRTHRWALQSVEYWQKDMGQQNVFGISQGGTNRQLRIESIQYMNSLPFAGIAVGGLSVGEPRPEFLKILETVSPYFDPNRPRYLMGVGTVVDILDSVFYGVDMFDCVLPTRNARNGQVFTSKGRLNLRNEIHKVSDKPIDETCECKVCKNYSLGYLRHLHNVKEILAFSLSTYHNLFFMKKFMEGIQTSVENGHFLEYREYWKNLYDI